MSGGDVERKLGITVSAEDLASGKLAGVKREVAGIQGAASSSGSAWGRFTGGIERGAGRMKTAIGGAVSHAKSQLGSLAGSAAGLLGFGGLLGGFALIGKSIQEAAAFGANVAIVAKTTGLALPVASAMVDTLDKWGLTSERLIPMLGKLEKNVGAIAGHKGGLAAFRKEFGVALTDSNGKILDANKLLLKSADYFNSNATATQKATFLSKLWGKQWQDMIPILSKGSAFIKDQEKNSIHLTQQQLDNITKYRNAQREFQDTLGDIEVKIGSVVMPLLTTGMVAITSWLDAHQDDIATWFQNAAGVAGQIASTAITVVQGIQAGWSAIPEPLRNLIVTGLVADRAMKFLFGFSPATLAVKIGADVLGGVAGAIAKASAGALLGAGIGKAFVQPVFVTNPGFGAGGGIPGSGIPGGAGVAGAGAAAEAGIGMTVGAAAAALAAGAGLGLIMAGAAEWIIANGKDPLNVGGRQATASARGLNPERVPAKGGSPSSRDAYAQWVDAGGKDRPQTGGPSLEDRTLREVVAAIGRQTGVINNADRWWSETAANTNRTTDSVEAARAQQVAKQDQAIAATNRTRDAMEANRIALQAKQFIAKVTTNLSVTNNIRAGAVTKSQTTFKQSNSGAGGVFAS